ncbi:MAG TPA: molybdopterin cofactor-binding domain-containing protein [Candidatus Elarobacter sp.]|nr:molybdopterin cofactor-binding domain-containing protein [Candidatus Elarobacter sp.]
MAQLSRSEFLALTSSCLVAAGIGGCAAPSATTFAPSAWLQIHADGMITLFLSKVEMGQGTMTGLTTLVAEELDAPLRLFRTQFAPSSPEFLYPGSHELGTGGSASMEESWLFLRRMGAAARAMLVRAAARQWSVDDAACVTRDATVVHPPTGRAAAYAVLVPAAAALAVPVAVPLKHEREFRLIGKRGVRLDAPAKVDGSAKFGIDLVVPNMRYAAISRPPVPGGTLRHVDDAKARAVPGVLDVVTISRGVAVIATNTWAAFRGKELLDLSWDDGPNAALDSATLFRESERLLADPAKVRIVRKTGALEHVRGTTIEATYRGPFLAHVTMEPMNATADVRPDACEVWAPTQSPTRCQQQAARITGLPPAKCIVHPTFIGGGFGRRLQSDYVEEAVEVSQRIKAPVKVTWTREDDLAHDFFRPMSVNVIRGVVDERGDPVGLYHAVASESIIRLRNPDGFKKAHGVDGASLDGIIYDFMYAIPNYTVGYVDYEHRIPVGPWRAPNANWNVFVVESFLDELAHAARRDPVELRLSLLARKPRAQAALRVATARAGWGKPKPDGVFQGVALTFWDTIGAIVADVSMTGGLKVHRVTAVIDCGTVINPDIVAAQTRGALAQGLSAALYEKVTIERGRPVQRNFDSYPVLRLRNMPEIDVSTMPSTAPPTGIGEPALPGIAPAVGNAVFAATGKRVRQLPFSDALA